MLVKWGERQTHHEERGFTLIEVMVAVVLVAVCLLGMAQFFASAGNRVMDSETRTLMHQVAAQEIDSMRSLPYGDIGTVAGNPSGSIPDVETKTVKGVPLEITREVIYVEDPSYSGPYPANYKRATVIVKATDSQELEPMQMSTNIGGGAEGGTLDITVTNLPGGPVADAQLRITNDHLIPHVNISTSAIRTDVNGHLMVPGLTPDNTNSYYVTATKTGYNDAATKEGLVVVKGMPFTVVQLIIDKLSGFTVHLTDGAGSARADVALTLKGHLSVEPWVSESTVFTDADGYAYFYDLRYGTDLEPYIIYTVDTYSPVLQLPSGVEPDSIDSSITLLSGQIGLTLDPDTQREVELELPNP
ncbi:MAG: carboxypeptidase regulatory-like domain-containing protein [Actinobacteria bacterium]|nr:carboxypeptidase regulatory-like domain-containing protein [Actinomycetota bacterium]